MACQGQASNHTNIDWLPTCGFHSRGVSGSPLTTGPPLSSPSLASRAPLPRMPLTSTASSPSPSPYVFFVFTRACCTRYANTRIRKRRVSVVSYDVIVSSHVTYRPRWKTNFFIDSLPPPFLYTLLDQNLQLSLVNPWRPAEDRISLQISIPTL